VLCDAQRDEDDGFVRTEVVYGTFYRAIPLPDGADEDNIQAAFRNGVLEVTVPVAQREANRRVQVRDAEGDRGDTTRDRSETNA